MLGVLVFGLELHPVKKVVGEPRVPDNREALRGFREQVIRHWKAALARRSQKSRITWERARRLADRWLPQPRILHPWPNARFDARPQGRSPVR